MKRAFLLLAATALPLTPVAAADPTPPVPIQPLASLIDRADYPPEAMMRREDGEVRMRLTVDPEGKVADCTIVMTSMSQSLDQASCRLVTARARFKPARDRRGRPVSGSVEQRLHWYLEAETAAETRVLVGRQMWAVCTANEGNRLTISTIPAEQAPPIVFARCTELEAFLDKQLQAAPSKGQTPAEVIAGMKAEKSIVIVKSIELGRRLLAKPEVPGAAPVTLATPAASALALAPADRAEIESILTRWETAWNTHDAAAWAALFHEDATWILWTGAEWHGHAAILAGITGPFRTFYANSIQLTKPVEIRLLAPGVAVARSLTTLTADTRQPGATIYGNKLLVLTRRGGVWKILFGQNTRLTEAEAAKLK